MQPLVFTPIPNIPLIHPGDDLSSILVDKIIDAGIDLTDGDIIVLAQKIVSKAENRLVNLRDVIPSPRALELGVASEKDPRLVELMLQESRSVLRYRPGTIIVEHKAGFVCANAGIDHSNVEGPYGNPEDWVLLLPENPDGSAAGIRTAIQERTGAQIGVMIIDSHGRAWRMGTVGVSIGFSGIPGLVDLRGQPDIFGYQLRVTQVAAADELAASASLVMGQADERIPVVHVRGFPFPLREGNFSELHRPLDLDLFR
ncbi:MAG TPA: coenzyme F420-0:L-glutamate ligase [Bellilinea sp.]|nr:coenzyme F420-0:L-glutamate ligase [Bellilinea sp.]